MNEVTICSVFTPAHQKVIAWNYALTEALNPTRKVSWLTVGYDKIFIREKAYQRARKASGGTLSREDYQRQFDDQLDVLHLCPNLQCVSSPQEEEIRQAIVSECPAGSSQVDQDTLFEKYAGSYAHGLAVERCLEKVSSRYALILDPDFYVVRPNWINDAIEHMQQNNLQLLGAPWHPRWFQKFRDFPCVHFLLMDREGLDLQSSQIRPQLISGRNSASEFWLDYKYNWAARSRRSRLNYLLRNWRQALREDLLQRQTIGRSRDTGFALREQLAHKTKMELLIPSYLPQRDVFEPRSVTRLQSRRLIERFLKPELCYSPPQNSFCALEFRHFGFSDLRAFDWEEFFWQGQPFGFHVRGEVFRQQHGSMASNALRQALQFASERAEDALIFLNPGLAAKAQPTGPDRPLRFP